MASEPEKRASSLFRLILSPLAIGESIPESDHFRDGLAAMEYFIPAVLAEVYQDWKRESLDGVLPMKASKTRDREAEVIGICFVASTQERWPIHLRFRVARLKDEISWFHCRLGEAGRRGPARDQQTELPRSLIGSLDQIDWRYGVVYGTR